MSKRYRIRDRVLLSAAILGDLFFEFVKSPYIEIKQFEGVLPPDYASSNFIASVNRMLRTGDIEKIVKDSEPYLRLTGQGKKALTRDFPLLELRRKRWDGKWRMVFYDIAESEGSLRKTIQYKLKSIGFGQLQKSVYISPLPISEDLHEFIDGKKLSDRVFIGTCKILLGSDDRQLAVRVWGLSELNDEYAEIMDDMDDFVDSKRKMNFDQLYSKFERILLADPFLPEELLPDWWLGNKAIKDMKKILRAGKWQ